MTLRLLQRQATGPPPDPARCAESNAHEILGITGAMMTLALITCGTRFAVRILMVKSFGADDYVMLSALLLAIATFACFIGEVHDAQAVGRHIECISPEQSSLFAKWMYVHSLIVMWGVVLVKISIALFLMRLVPPGKNWKAILWATIVFLIAFMLACTGTLVFQCWPIKAAWDFAARQTASCFSNDTFSAIGLMNSCINVVTDFLLAALPIPVIIKLQVNRRTKISLIAILSLGYFACAAGIVKAVKQSRWFDEADPFWHNSFNVWNMIELCIGITAASLPALRPLFAKILASTKDAFSYSFGSKDRTTPSANLRSKNNLSENHDVALSDMKYLSASSHNDSISKSHRNKASVDEDPLFPTGGKRYTVGVTATHDHSDDGSWEDVEMGGMRNGSQERLTRNSLTTTSPTQNHQRQIFKTTDITSSSHHVDDASVRHLR
ncbi:hypothetical protein CB0940_07853 [Cercospora beticola]|uniref:Rhodopsin domain-containing protein n=1 Tax=Cercospora beticola TaxID=122368 RepID=A0A2G5H7U3_CERBT|nr:hypothetical protein CB0940_07853 [Cercospora beticola]PIA88596.1 hypothetical protein CB0940_07853 [Cercospora beticola]WPB03821.1 hypothetical protein RHO25_008465 [Cercospora beticola]CAK1357409.1 unnamed protein product [Cercospora beticola]